MTRLTSLLIAAAAVATVVGFTTPGEAHDWRQGNRSDRVYNGQRNYGFQQRGQWQQYRFGTFGFGWRQHRLGPRQIRWALQRQGFHRIRDIQFRLPARGIYRRGIYRAVAVGRHGRTLQVWLHPGSGQVLRVQPEHTPWLRLRPAPVRHGHDRDFVENRDRQPDRNRDRDTVRRGHDRDFVIAQRDDRNRNTVRRGHDRDFAENRDRQPAMAQRAERNRNRDTVRRGHDRDFAENRDRQLAMAQRAERNRNRR